MPSSESFVDIHCHLLPGLDDGARNWEDSLAMARIAEEEGVRTVIATPHQLGAYGHNTSDAIREQVAALQNRLDGLGIELRILPGADVRIEEGLIEHLQSGSVLSLGDYRRHVLLELPHELYMPLESLVEALSAVGMTGVLSHPERNRGLLDQPKVVPQLIEMGLLMQVTAESLTGTFGRSVQAFTEHLIQKRWVHMISTDAHGPRRRPPKLRKAFNQVVATAGRKTATDLFCCNPAQVAAGEPVVAPRRTHRHAWPVWLRRGLAAVR